MTVAEKQMHICCFTGHRPEKLTRSEEEIKADLEKAIRQAMADGLNVFITGMARGVDIWAAEIVIQLREFGMPIRLICASPFEGFERSWQENWQRRYHAVMQAADHTLFVCPGYSKSCFQIRNEWMVNHSARVIAVFNGERGGTRNTLNYAEKCGIQLSTING